MKKHLITACLYTVITSMGLGIVYPLLVTGIARLAFHNQADGQLIVQNGELRGSHIIGQPFTGAGYFHSRPSSAGTGYDASSSSGSNLAPTSKALVDKVNTGVTTESASGAVPVDLVTASGSGLDPDITPAAALYQVPRVARERHLYEATVQQLVIAHTMPRQFGLLGEPRTNVLDLNIALESLAAKQ